MDGTPRIKKRVSLTLRRHHKRDASPNILHEKVRSKIISNDNNIDNDEYNTLITPKSPSVTSLSTDVGIESTPPHKKINLDESVDYSPKCFDTSFSPTCLLSQTLSSSSPEVGWKWGRHSVDEKLETAITTPDSAYAADSSFTSAGSSSTELTNAIGRIQSEPYVQRSGYEMRREDQRRRLEMQMRRAEKLRADELLKQRCAKLEEQLREAEKRRREDMEYKMDSQKQSQFQKQEVSESHHKIFYKEVVAECASVEDISANANDTLHDFLNDSDSDSLLLAASQQAESKIVDITTEVVKSEGNSYTSTKKETNSQSEISRLSEETIASERQDKRSSLYLKLQGDDDLFLSLDEVILQATQQVKKPRNNFQRHNSMPINTSAFGCAELPQRKTTISTSTSCAITSTASTSKTVSSSNMKRHASSHALSPSSSAANSYRDRPSYNRK